MKARYSAQDEDGDVYNYENKPTVENDAWWQPNGDYERVWKREKPNPNWKTACYDLSKGEPVIIDGILCAPGTVKKEDKIFGTVNDAIRQHKTNRTPEQFDEHLRANSCIGQDRKHSHYYKDVSKLDVIDVYRIIDLWKITDPCDQHALKKILVPGERGHKGIIQDTQDVIDTMQRKLEMFAENVK